MINAPDETPIMFASASGFCSAACNNAPDTANIAPTIIAIRILGNRKSIIESNVAFSPVVNLTTKSLNDSFIVPVINEIYAVIISTINRHINNNFYCVLSSNQSITFCLYKINHTVASLLHQHLHLQ